MKILMLLVTGALLMLNMVAADEMDTDVVAKLFSRVCATCHGPAGQGMASFPRLTGREANYVASRLRQYRAGEKVGPNSPLMIPHAINLSDADIDHLAAYISTTLSAK